MCGSSNVIQSVDCEQQKEQRRAIDLDDCEMRRKRKTKEKPEGREKSKGAELDQLKM